MKEFKFACPVCGQHMAATPEQTGAHVQCPSCFRELIVPPPPSGESQTFIITASEYRRPASPEPPELPVSMPPLQHPKKHSTLAGVIGVMAVGLVVALGFLLARTQHDGHRPGATGRHAPGTSRHSQHAWTFDTNAMRVPDTPAAGILLGRTFICDRAVFQGSTLNLRQGRDWPPELGLSIELAGKTPEQLAGQRCCWTDTSEDRPRLILRWKDNGQPMRKAVAVPFIVVLEFDQVRSNRLTGGLYCCIADDSKSVVAGRFDAQIRAQRPRTQPVPTQPRPSRPPG